jgi:ArsR family transcriptional regulator, lead/cadmium/zinc/bismuth-responsive transcriptional repressor
MHETGQEPRVDDGRLIAQAQHALASAADLDAAAERFAVLADPGRLRILFCIHSSPGMRSGDIAAAVGAVESTASHALRLLRTAGWVRAERRGREVRYHLDDAEVHDLLHSLGSGHAPGVVHDDTAAAPVHVHRHQHRG